MGEACRAVLAGSGAVVNGKDSVRARVAWRRCLRVHAACGGGQDGATALSGAAEEGCNECIVALLEARADPNIPRKASVGACTRDHCHRGGGGGCSLR